MLVFDRGSGAHTGTRGVVGGGSHANLLEELEEALGAHARVGEVGGAVHIAGDGGVVVRSVGGTSYTNHRAGVLKQIALETSSSSGQLTQDVGVEPNVPFTPRGSSLGHS